MIKGNWKVAGYDRDAAVVLHREGISALVAVILASRGFKTRAEAGTLIDEDMSGITDPMLLKDMDKAIARVKRAVETGEHVAVYGDYDVDGVTASSLLSHWLRSQGLECEIYIPERLDEGYGVKSSGIEALAKKGVTLVITVDCGITAAEETEYARSLGVDVVITDHHECSDRLPDAVAVVDPKRPDNGEVGRTLAGVGVAFKLVCALEGENSAERVLKEYGDLVAVGTIADVMEVTGENRAFIRRGMELLRKNHRHGLTALCRAAGIDETQVTVTTVGFALAPRLNAAGRLGRTSLSVRLLLTENETEAQELAEELCELNRERQRLEATMFSEAIEMLDGEAPDGPIILASDKWHQGVSGVVCSRLTERFGVPSVVICLADGEGRGSCRSANGFSIYSALDSCRELLTTFGGHDMAAGLSIREENVAELRRCVREYYKAHADSLVACSVSVDFEVIKPGLLTVDNVDDLKLLEPYGNGNPQPLLCMTDAKISGVLPISAGKHTKLWVQKNKETFECIFFSKTIEELGVEIGKNVDIAFTPQINEYRGKRSVQLLLCDLIVR